jgi:asparagine synthase (glutamine-hydrolysing)
MLSGGLDSSSIVAFARRELAEHGRPPLETLTISFARGSAQDEQHFVDAVVAQGQVRANSVDASGIDPVADALAESAASDEPIPGGNVCLSRALYAAAQRLGVDVLFDGTDGDTVVSHGTGRFAELFARGRWWTLVQEARAFAAALQRPTFDVVRRLAIAPVVRARARRAPRLLGLVRRIRGDAAGGRSLLRPEVVRRFGLDEVRARALAATSDLERYSSERELHLHALSGAIHPFVFEQLDRLAARHGVEPRYPMFDLPFVRFCLSLPAEQKLSGGWTRRVMREAMAPLLPKEVAWRRRKSNFSPNFVAAVRGHLLRPGPPPEEEWKKLLGDFVEPERLRHTADRLRSFPRVEDALSIWGILTLSHWLETRRTPRE